MEILRNAVAAVVLAFLVVATYQFIVSTIERRRYPPQGELVSAGGHRLHVQIAGAGIVTVVFESGAGGFCLDWEAVRRPVASFARVITYDRAGYAWSNPGPMPRDAKQIARELHQLLNSLEISSPLVLVGHSVGALYVQLYTGQYPKQVAGLVLVDPAHRLTKSELLNLVPPEQRSEGEKIYHQYFVDNSGTAATLTRLIVSPLGLFRLFGLVLGERLMQAIPPYTVLPPSLKSVYKAMFYQTGYFRTRIAEGSAVGRSAEQAHMLVPTLGDLPLIVLTAAAMGGLPYQKSVTVFPRLQRLWQLHHDGHSAIARHSINGEHVVAQRSAHYIQADRPDLVIAAIRQVVNRAEMRAK